MGDHKLGWDLPARDGSLLLPALQVILCPSSFVESVTRRRWRLAKSSAGAPIRRGYRRCSSRNNTHR